jgi:hypothetical protein
VTDRMDDGRMDDRTDSGEASFNIPTSFPDVVSVIWGVAESASQRLLTSRNGQV